MIKNPTLFHTAHPDSDRAAMLDELSRDFLAEIEKIRETEPEMSVTFEFDTSVPGELYPVLPDLYDDGVWIDPAALKKPARIGPWGLSPEQEAFLEQIRGNEDVVISRINSLLERAISPMTMLDIDDALMRYCEADTRATLILDSVPMLLDMLEEPAPDAPSYPVSNLPAALRPDPDPFRKTDSQKDRQTGPAGRPRTARASHR